MGVDEGELDVEDGSLVDRGQQRSVGVGRVRLPESCEIRQKRWRVARQDDKASKASVRARGGPGKSGRGDLGRDLIV